MVGIKHEPVCKVVMVVIFDFSKGINLVNCTNSFIHNADDDANLIIVLLFERDSSRDLMHDGVKVELVGCFSGEHIKVNIFGEVIFVYVIIVYVFGHIVITRLVLV